MTKMICLLLAALSPAAILAQKAAPTPTQGLSKAGINICGHTLDAGTLVDARSKNASGGEALVIRWLDPNPKGAAVHSAVFMGRCIARDGDTIDGKVIVQVLPNSLVVSERHGLTAYEAEYRENFGLLGDGPSRRGAFIENRFVTELDAGKSSEPAGANKVEADFHWNEEEETLALKPGLVPPAEPSPHFVYESASSPTAPSKPAQTPPAATQPGCTPQQGPQVGVRVPKKPSAWACKTLGICVEDKPVVLSGDGGCPAAPAKGQTTK